MFKTLLRKLADITPQRTLADIAKENDIVFTDRTLEIKSTIVQNPFKTALDYTKDKMKTSIAVFGDYYILITPDATWMRALRLYQEIELEKLRNRS